MPRASEMFGVPVEGMDPAMVRSRAKAINFGIVYGISAFGLSNQLGIPQDEAGAYIKTYFERFPGIRDYMDRTRTFVREHAYVTTLFGRRNQHPPTSAPRRKACASSPSAPPSTPRSRAPPPTSIRRAMIRMPAALKAEGLSARMLLQVHDELVFEAPQAEAQALCALAARVMSQAAETRRRPVGAPDGGRPAPPPTGTRRTSQAWRDTTIGTFFSRNEL